MARRRLQSSSESGSGRSRSPSSRRGRGFTPILRGRSRTPTSRSGVNSARRSYSRSASRARSRSARNRHYSPPLRPTHGPRLPPTGAVRDPIKMFGEMKKVVLEQFEDVSRTLAVQKDEMEEKLNKSSIKFAQKPIEKQFEVNARILALNHKMQKVLKNKDYKRVKSLVREQEEELKEHQENLMIAEFSQHGWLTVSKIRGEKHLDSSVIKKIQQVDALIDMAKHYDLDLVVDIVCCRWSTKWGLSFLEEILKLWN